MPTRTYAEAVRLRESNDYEELSRTKILMRDPATGIVVIWDAAKELKGRKAGLVPIGEEEGEQVRIELEKAFAPVRARLHIAEPEAVNPADEEPVVRLRRMTLPQLRDLARETGVLLRGTLRKDDLVTLLLQMHHSGLRATPAVSTGLPERVVTITE